MELEIFDLSAAGEGVGRADGRVIFVDGALPEEVVDAEVTTRKKRYAKAKLKKVLRSSNERVKPICPYFGTCGGCQLMHLSYEAQLSFKQRRVQEALRRIGGFDVEVRPCISSEPLGYRNKIHLHRGGFNKRHSHEVVPIKACAIHNPIGEKVIALALDKKEAILKTSFANEEVLVVADGKVFVVDRDGHVQKRQTIIEKLGSMSFEIGPRDFFQVNVAQALKLYSYAIDFAQLADTDKVIDAYCGVGTLTLLASTHVKRIHGIESGRGAIDAARRNAKLNGITNASFECALVEESELDCDVLFLNPPRSGLDSKVIDMVLAKAPMRLVYISCDPATLARDLKRLSARFTLQDVQPIDMFPQTAHVETVVSMKIQPSDDFEAAKTASG